jgi:hypothetical protein
MVVRVVGEHLLAGTGSIDELVVSLVPSPRRAAAVRVRRCFGGGAGWLWFVLAVLWRGTCLLLLV